MRERERRERERERGREREEMVKQVCDAWGTVRLQAFRLAVICNVWEKGWAERWQC